MKAERSDMRRYNRKDEDEKEHARGKRRGREGGGRWGNGCSLRLFYEACGTRARNRTDEAGIGA